MEAEENVHLENQSDPQEPGKPEADESLAPQEPEQTAQEELAASAEGEPVIAGEGAETTEPAEGSYDDSSPRKWFIIHTYSGFENKVKESLQTRAEAFGFADKIGQ